MLVAAGIGLVGTAGVSAAPINGAVIGDAAECDEPGRDRAALALGAAAATGAGAAVAVTGAGAAAAAAVATGPIRAAGFACW